MREIDDTIKSLMAGFRDAEPSAGMQSRILEAVENRSPIRSWRLPSSVAGAFVGAAILASTCMVVIKFPHPQHPAANADHVDAQPGPPTESAARKTIPGALKKPPRVFARPPHRLGGSVMSETEMASYPAPPLPLTEQERLLLHLAHRHDAESVAILHRDLQAAESARADEQFQHFFGMDAKEMRNESE